MGWLEYFAAFAGFFAAHNIPTRPAIKAWLQARLTPRGFTIAYSVVSLGALYWLLMAAGRAPVVVLWDWQPWHTHVTLAAMCVVVLILTLTVARPNPFSFGGARNAEFNPSRPGLIRYTRHPILMALAIWAFAHLVPNGTLAHVILFTTFGGFALMGMRLIDRRKQLDMANWQALQDQISASPRVYRPQHPGNLMMRLILSVAIYIGLIHSHGPILGAYPLP